MKVALVQDWLTGFAGGEQVLLALHQMYPEAPIFTSFHNPAKTKQFEKAQVITSFLQKWPGLSSHEKLAIPAMPAAFESFDLKGYDVIISVGGGLSKGVITHPGQRHISYCHTPIRYIWRLGGDNRNEGKWDGWLREWAMHRMRIWDVATADRPDIFVANSTTVQRRIKKIYRRDSVVVSPPVDMARFKVSTESDDFFLTVGRMVEYKRTDLIIEACIKARQKLKVVGAGPEEDRLRRLADSSQYIEFMGRVSDEELTHLYSRTKAFVFAAEEDAGIVPVEAMACGKPVIAYQKGGVTDVVVEGVHGTYFPQQTVDSLVEALERFGDMKFESSVIRKHAEAYRIEAFQEKMRNLIEHE